RKMSRQRASVNHSAHHQEDALRRLLVKEDSRQRRRRRRRKKPVERPKEKSSLRSGSAIVPQGMASPSWLSPLWRFPRPCTGPLSHHGQPVWRSLVPLTLFLLASSQWAVCLAQTYAVSSSSSPAPSGHYIECKSFPCWP